jgi:hypothetical protein
MDHFFATVKTYGGGTIVVEGVSPGVGMLALLT